MWIDTIQLSVLCLLACKVPQHCRYSAAYIPAFYEHSGILYGAAVNSPSFRALREYWGQRCTSYQLRTRQPGPGYPVLLLTAVFRPVVFEECTIRVRETLIATQLTLHKVRALQNGSAAELTAEAEYCRCQHQREGSETGYKS